MQLVVFATNWCCPEMKTGLHAINCGLLQKHPLIQSHGSGFMILLLDMMMMKVLLAVAIYVGKSFALAK